MYFFCLVLAPIGFKKEKTPLVSKDETNPMPEFVGYDYIRVLVARLWE